MIKKLFTRGVLLALVLSIASCVVHRIDVVPVDVSAEVPIEISSGVKAHELIFVAWSSATRVRATEFGGYRAEPGRSPE